jgi:hypothetical protein
MRTAILLGVLVCAMAPAPATADLQHYLDPGVSVHVEYGTGNDTNLPNLLNNLCVPDPDHQTECFLCIGAGPGLVAVYANPRYGGAGVGVGPHDGGATAKAGTGEVDCPA